jgi:hypothetical protein
MATIGLGFGRLALLGSLAVLPLFASLGCRRSRVVPRPSARATTSASAARATAPHGAILAVPRVDPPPKIDGELDELAWSDESARTGAFVGAGGSQVRPYSDARLLWSPGALDLALYAADQDIRPGSDAFVVVLAAHDKRATLRFGPRGLLRGTAPNAESAALEAGARVGVDLDGTVDDASDDDEEWVIESSIPLAPLGLKGEVGEELTIAIERCDTPKGAATVCGHFGVEARPRVLRFQ